MLPFELVEILKYNWLALPGALIVSTLARISITILLVKLFGDTNKLFKWFIISLTVLLSALSTALLFITFLQVTPTEALWNILMTGPVRYNLDPHVWAYLAYLVQCESSLSIDSLLLMVSPLPAKGVIEQILTVSEPITSNLHVHRPSFCVGASHDHMEAQHVRAAQDWSHHSDELVTLYNGHVNLQDHLDCSSG